jgi:hypothetical protein
MTNGFFVSPPQHWLLKDECMGLEGYFIFKTSLSHLMMISNCEID